VHLSVLIVDDDPINLEILGSILEDKYELTKAVSGTEALSIMVDKQPDLVLLDLHMPELDGFEVLARMRSDNNLVNIPVIFVTGETDSYQEAKGLGMGAVDYIKKPYDSSIIPLKVNNHIKLKRLRDNLEDEVKLRTRELTERSEQLLKTHGAIIMGMSLLSESRDKVTGMHLIRIKTLTNLLATAMNKLYPQMIDSSMVDMITEYSPLHDVGKVAVPDAVLKKSGGLTPEEFTQMKEHTTGGGDLLRQIANLWPGEVSQLNWAVEIAENHHEKYDGSGYPHSKEGELIPLSARIVSVSDIYDALRSPRSYKPGFTHEEAMNIILVGDGRTSPDHFDPYVLEAFESVHEDLRDAYDNNPDPGLITK